MINNAPKVQAFNSYYAQAKSLYSAGDLAAARELFLKAAALANEISISSSAYDVRMEYHKMAVKLLDFARTKCVRQATPASGAAPAKKSEQDGEVKSFSAEKGGAAHAVAVVFYDSETSTYHRNLVPPIALTPYVLHQFEVLLGRENAILK